MSAPPANWSSVVPYFGPIANGLECGLLLIDEHEKIVLATQPLAVMLGTTVEAIVAMTPDRFVDHVAWMVDSPPPLLRDRRILPRDGKIVCEEFELAGSYRTVIRWVARPITTPWPGTAIVCSDVTAEVSLAAAFDRVSVTDSLTKLPNRRAAEQVLDREASLGRRQNAPLGVAVLGVDGLDRVNAEQGQGGGDQVLRRIGRLLGSLVEKPDFAARWTGAQFLVVLPNTALAAARVRADGLRTAIADAAAHGKIKMTVCGGVAEVQADEAPDEALARAQQQLAAARLEGPNRIR